MKRKKLIKKIKRRKNLMNFLLLFLTPSNIFMIKLSQNLDKHIAKYQSYLSFRHYKRAKIKVRARLIA